VLVGIDAVNVMVTHQPVVQACGASVGIIKSIIFTVNEVFLLSYSDLFVSSDCRCLVLTLHLITPNDTHTHIHTR
jgi:hypothetical protein